MNFCHPLKENIFSLRGLPPPDPLLTGSLFLATPLQWITECDVKLARNSRPPKLLTRNSKGL
jgi:hypothetical protein